MYNLLQRVVVLFFIYLSFVLPPLSHTGIIFTKIEIYIVALHYYCQPSCIPPTLLRTYQHLGLNSCYNFLTSLLARFLISGELRYAPKMLHITTLGALDPGSLQTDLSGRWSGSKVEQIGPAADVEHGQTVPATRLSSELSTPSTPKHGLSHYPVSETPCHHLFTAAMGIVYPLSKYYCTLYVEHSAPKYALQHYCKPQWAKS